MIDSLIADSFCHSEIMTGTRMSKLLQWFKLPWLVASSSMLFAESPALDSIFQSSNLFHFFISKFQCLLSLYAASTYFSLLHWKSPDNFVKSQIKGKIRAIALVTILGVKQRREKNGDFSEELSRKVSWTNMHICLQISEIPLLFFCSIVKTSFRWEIWIFLTRSFVYKIICLQTNSFSVFHNTLFLSFENGRK